MRKYFIIINLFLIGSVLNAQEFVKCEVDFSILEWQHPFNYNDIGKTYIIDSSAFPKYFFQESVFQSRNEIEKEWDKQVKDNEEYNNNNKQIGDSLWKARDRKLDSIGIEIFYFISLNKFLKSTELFKPSLTLSDIKNYIKLRANYIDNKFDPRLSEIFFNVKRSEISDCVTIYNMIEKKDSIILLFENKLYLLNSKRISKNDPIITKRFDKCTEEITRVGDIYLIPIGSTPIFSYDSLKGKDYKLSAIVKQDNVLNRAISIALNFIANDSSSLRIYHFQIQPSRDKKYKDISREIFIDKKRLLLINNYFENLKTKDLTILDKNRPSNNWKILAYNFSYSKLTIKLEKAGNQRELTYLPTKFDDSYNNDWPFDFEDKAYYPKLSYSDCYLSEMLKLKSKILPKNFYSNPELINKLLRAVKESEFYSEYEVRKVLLTPNSNWIISSNKYSGIAQDRSIVADVYVKSKEEGFCYLIHDVLFMQKLDPLNQYSYKLFVATPNDFELYPCLPN